MGGVSLRSSLHIVGLQIVDVNALVVKHTIEPINGKLLIDAVNGSLNIFLALVEVVSINRTQGCLVQVGAAVQQ